MPAKAGRFSTVVEQSGDGIVRVRPSLVSLPALERIVAASVKCATPLQIDGPASRIPRGDGDQPLGDGAMGRNSVHVQPSARDRRGRLGHSEEILSAP